MKLIIGLGNPGEKYLRTRHNAGFMFLDYLQGKLASSEFSHDEKFESLISSATLDGQKVFLVKPETFMNDSGRAVGKLLHFYKLTPPDILVIHDELDLELGHYKAAINSRAAGHNGVQNIIDVIGTQEFLRLRLGISRPAVLENGSCISTHDYVLQNFSEDEAVSLRTLFPALESEVEKFLS